VVRPNQNTDPDGLAGLPFSSSFLFQPFPQLLFSFWPGGIFSPQSGGLPPFYFAGGQNPPTPCTGSFPNYARAHPQHFFVLLFDEVFTLPKLFLFLVPGGRKPRFTLSSPGNVLVVVALPLTPLGPGSSLKQGTIFLV